MRNKTSKVVVLDSSEFKEIHFRKKFAAVVANLQELHNKNNVILHLTLTFNISGELIKRKVLLPTFVKTHITCIK